jgi:hypothetical protein
LELAPLPLLHSVTTAQSDSVRNVWGPVTIRVAWVLYRAGHSPAQHLVAAREHVLLSLPKDVHATQAEELAAFFTKEYLDRRIRGNYRQQEMESCGVEPQYRWRDRLLESLDSLGELVFRLGYGDALSLDQIAETTKTDAGILSSSKIGIRSALRAILEQEGVAIARSDNNQLDLLIARLALLAPSDCAGGEEILRSDKRSHVERCPRCIRGLRLIRANQIVPSDLNPPTDRWNPPHTSVIALHFHPDARQRRAGVLSALNDRALFADDDTLLIDPDHVPDLSEQIWDLLLHGKPAKHQLRGSLARGSGRWSEGALLGPVAGAAMKRTRSQQWGVIDSLDELPEPLPEPPSPARWWLAALFVTLLAILGGVLALRTPDPQATYPLTAEFRTQNETATTRFDAHDQAYLAIISQGLLGLRIEHVSAQAADKGSLGTGEGDYQLLVENQGLNARLLVVSNPQTLGELQELIAMASISSTPLDQLSSLIEDRYPQADIKLQPSLF